jgi:hypothetical protein
VREKFTAFTGLQAVVSVCVMLGAVLFCIYPAAVTALSLAKGTDWLVPTWFNSLSGRFESWAGGHLAAQAAHGVNAEDVAATEWPMFGSVFFLLAAEELQARGAVDARTGDVRRAVERAAAVVVSPDTAAWVKKKWGDSYLERENTFYRMLLIMGTSSFERITGDVRHHAMMTAQRKALAAELERAPHTLLDDYPGECWPNDVLWAVAAIQRAAALDGESHDALARKLIAALDGPLNVGGLPAFTADKTTGHPVAAPRGCGNSGLLCFAAELDVATAARWFDAYDEAFWSEGTWAVGFREHAKSSRANFQDVDSGPVVFGIGSVASAFGIGAARTAGRMDRAEPLALEAVACSWPTPFGFLVPRAMGELAMGGGCLGETALLFAMTRPNRTAAEVPFRGSVPFAVWGIFLVYLVSGAWLLRREVSWWRRKLH